VIFEAISHEEDWLLDYLTRVSCLKIMAIIKILKIK
jgi:hypothetical protein